MTAYEFSIIASGPDPRAEDFETRFYEAGCDDATISFQKGHIIVDFAREARSVEDAVASAIGNVIAAGAKVDRVEPDPLVSLSDIAARSHMTRAAMTQYAKGQRSKGFPAPVARVTSESPLWDWPTVARWLYERNKLPRESVVAAMVLKSANEALSGGRAPAPDELRRGTADLDRAS